MANGGVITEAASGFQDPDQMAIEAFLNASTSTASMVGKDILDQTDINRAVHLTREQQVILLRSAYTYGFQRDYNGANETLAQIALGNLQRQNFHAGSLAENAATIEQVRMYFENFCFFNANRQYPFPTVRMAIVPTFHAAEDPTPLYIQKGIGKASIMASGTQFSRDLLTSFIPSIQSVEHFQLPALIDRTPLTLKQWKELMRLEGAQGLDLYAFYEEAREANIKENKANILYQAKPEEVADPIVQRMIVLVPTSDRYTTNALFTLNSSTEPTTEDDKRKRGLNPLIRVGGELNTSTSFMVQEYFGRHTFGLNIGGREGFFKLSRPTGDLTLAGSNAYQDYSIAVALFPYIERPFGGRAAKGNLEAEKALMMGNMGGIKIEAGNSALFSAHKAQESFFGDLFDPDFTRKPVIITIRLFSYQEE